MLVISMMTGCGVYLIYHSITSPALHSAGPALESVCRIIQPLCLFAMLFLSFCKIEPKQIKLEKWHGWLLLIQGGIFAAIVLSIRFAAGNDGNFAEWVISNRTVAEAFMLCIICPTATASAVVTGKLGGDMAGVITYTILINLLVSILVPLLIPMIYPASGLTFTGAFIKILAKVFPLLIMPCITAWAVRYLLPKLHRRLVSHEDTAFHIWAFSLSLAILMSTRAIVRSDCGVRVIAGIALASAASCVFQFAFGKKTGARYGSGITAGQALGQKNTVFGIWMGYTFMDPVVSIAGGMYSLWHNVFNTWQLRRHEERKRIQ